MASITDCFHFLWSPVSPLVKAWLKKHLDHLKLYEARLGELEEGIQNLKKAREHVEHKVDEEDNRYGRGIPKYVEDWIEAVETIIVEYDNFDKDEGHKHARFDFCTSGHLPNIEIRYRLSSQAFDVTERVNGLLRTENTDTFSYWLGPPSMVDFFHNVSYENFPSREETMKKIKEALKSPKVRMIGLHGESGLGKTTLVKEIAREALEANTKMFDVVAMANVTRNPDIRKIQGHIADMLGMKLDDESDIGRAAQIRTRLKKEKESTLIVLDDLWAPLDFNMLGIPLSSDDDDKEHSRTKTTKETPSGNVKGKNPGENSKQVDLAANVMKSIKLHGASRSSSVKTEETHSYYKGCKVLLISESKQVLLSRMEGKEHYIFSVEALKEKEAETFFKKMAGIGDGKSEFDKLAAQIASKCNGLPMSIVTTARALKNQSRSAWEDVHRQFEMGKLTGSSELSTKLSYDLLENEELKYAFLLCARMGPDALIMDLVKYCIGLGFLQGVHTVKEVRDRVNALVGKLKVSGLLSDSYSNDHFTMQDIVRSAALSIASKEKHVFTVTKEKIDEWPDDDKLERYVAISLHHCHIIDEFPPSINCPKLRVFHVNNNDPHMEIPQNLFEGMKELRVLILTGINLSPFPSSIRCLTKLRMLCLENCKLGEKLSIIGELKKLRILSLSGSDIEKLPVELKHLTKLQIFDISNCSKLGEIPSNVISSFISLEELYMRNTLIQEQAHQSKNVILSELRHLNQLTTLDIQIPNGAHLPENLFFDKLYSYQIVIGDLNAHSEIDFKMPEKYEASRFLAIQVKDGFDIHSQKGIKMLFERVENLLLEELNGVRDIFYRLNLKGFPYLKHLLIVNNSDIRSLINPKDRKHTEKAFPKLESLSLYNLKNMKKICSCKLAAPSFSKLKVIKISLCGKLNNVFLFSVISLLTFLETIEVSECNALKEIVPLEMQSSTNEIEVLRFPELLSLTLLSLPELIGFYPILSTEGNASELSIEGNASELFHEKVEVSKLERMVLSSIQIGKIWSDQSSQCFRNLIHLDVNGCCNLEYLISFSTATSLEYLQSLFVSECVKMTSIFPQGQGSHAKLKDIFPNLKNIKLSRMRSLKEIWNCELPSNSFSKLDTLIIEECDKFGNVFPCYMEGIFKSLCNLRVTNCMSMKVIFDLDDEKADVRDVANMQEIHLEELPKLEYIWKWSKDRDGNLKLDKLQRMSVHDCWNLQNIFPFSIANHLHNLEYLAILDCLGLREIVAKGDIKTDIPNPSFEFPKLTTIKFLELPKLSSFYAGHYEISFPALNNLSIEHCDRLYPFRKEITQPQGRPLPTLFSEKVINILKRMQIEGSHANCPNSYIGEGNNHRRDSLEELCIYRVDPKTLYSFLLRNPNLKSLSLNDFSHTNIVPHEMPPEIENLGVVPKLKSLKIIEASYLTTIGFEQDIILERIELLILKNCPRLDNIMSSSVSLTHLTNIEVVNCGGLRKLMPLSAAKSLVQLNSMKVIKCESMVEILENEEDNAGEVDIIFRQLKVVELVSLNNLNCFSDSCVVEFPLLEKLVVSACPNMKNFSKGVKSTELLQKIYVVPETQKRWCWKDNINATIQYIFKEKMFFEGMDEITDSEYPVLQETLYQSSNLSQQKNWFCSLTTLKLEYCGIQSCAIPSNILPCLKCLKQLEVWECNNIKAIFDFNDAEIMGTRPTFQNLQQVTVGDCKNLKSLFPVAMAENVMMKLEKLQLVSCPKMQGIVGRDASGKEVTKKFEFPNLNYLHLVCLPKLTHFYPGTFTLKCPALIDLAVVECSELDLFQSAHLEGESEASSSTSIKEQQPIFLDETAISNLEELALNSKDASSAFLWFRKFKSELVHLNRLALFLDDDNNKQLISLIEILEMTPHVKEMEINYCSNPELLFNQSPRMDEERMLGQLEILRLDGITNFKVIGSEGSSCLNKICQRLRHLKQLHIMSCHELNYIFTSSVVKELKCLKEIELKNCDEVKQIVKRDGDTSEGVKFERLEFIHLEDMESLQCFYSGSDNLQLPSLLQVDIRSCIKMEIFSQGLIETKSTSGIRVNDEMFCDDLNEFVGVAFMRRVKQDPLVVAGGSPLWKSIWLRSMPVPNLFLRNLTSLTVEGCDFLSNAIIPSHLLRILSNLKLLEVRKCNSVKAIFDQTEVNGTESASERPSIRLVMLILEELPNLEHFWNEDPQESLSLPCLEEVKVDGCKSIISLFPASVKADGVQILHVKNCERLMEIVAKDDVAAEEANKLPKLVEVVVVECKSIISLFPASVKTKELRKLLVKDCERLVEIVAKDDVAAEVANKDLFPSVNSLMLWNLPSLSCIYPGMHIVKWPKLNRLDILNCQMLKNFATGFQNPEEQNSFLANRQACVSLDKVTPNLKELALGEEEAILIEQGKLNVEYCSELYWLELQYFSDELDIFAFLSCSRLPPSIEVFMVANSAFKEIFSSTISDSGKMSKFNSQVIKKFRLVSLPQLESIGLEHPWMEYLVGKLEIIYVGRCDCLTNLTPSNNQVSFSNLTMLMVGDCGGLKYLFSSSTAKTLYALEEIEVTNCGSIQNIVANEDEVEDESTIVFEKLRSLYLSSLPKLGSFYSGSSTLNFPSLKNVSLRECDNMVVFSSGVVVTGKVVVTATIGIKYSCDLNDVVKQCFEKGRGQILDNDGSKSDDNDESESDDNDESESDDSFN